MKSTHAHVPWAPAGCTCPEQRRLGPLVPASLLPASSSRCPQQHLSSMWQMCPWEERNIFTKLTEEPSPSTGEWPVLPISSQASFGFWKVRGKSFPNPNCHECLYLKNESHGRKSQCFSLNHLMSVLLNRVNLYVNVCKSFACLYWQRGNLNLGLLWHFINYNILALCTIWYPWTACDKELFSGHCFTNRSQ